MTDDQSTGYGPSPVGISGMVFLFLNLYVLTAFTCTLNAQQIDNNVISALDKFIADCYGPDQNLINGIEYYNLHTRSKGHKFLDEDKFYRGRVVINKRVYDDVELKYDIFNQHVLLQFDRGTEVYTQIILNNKWVDEFELNGRIFRKHTFPETGTLFFQIIGSGEIACYYHFKKEEVPRVTRITLSEFGDEKRKSYVYWQSELHEFHGARSFAEIFPAHESQILEFIRQQNFRTRKISDSQMDILISYCNTLINSPTED